MDTPLDFSPFGNLLEDQPDPGMPAISQVPMAPAMPTAMGADAPAVPQGGGFSMPEPFIDQIKKFEGFAPQAKWDYKQHSVGYGTRGNPGEAITPEVADARLREELAQAARIVEREAPNAPEGVKAALTSLTFNAGTSWVRSGLGEAVRAGDYERAKERFVQYNKAGGQTLPGLVSRRQAEVQWFDQRPGLVRAGWPGGGSEPKGLDFSQFGTPVETGSGQNASLPDFSQFGSEVGKEPSPVTFAQSFGRGVDQMQGMLYGGVEAVGEATGIKGLTDFGREGRERNKKEAEAYGKAAEFTEIRGAGDFGQWAKETIGSQIPIMGPTMGGAVGGAVTGGMIAGPLGVTIGGLIGAFIPSFTMGVGEVQGNIKERDPNAVVPGYAFAGGAAIAALDSIMPGKIGSALVRRFGAEAAEEIAKRALTKEAADGFIKRTAKGAVTGLATEAVTEALQEAIGDYAAALGTDQDLSPDLPKKMIEAAAAGGLLGGITGGAGSARAPGVQEAKARGGGSPTMTDASPAPAPEATPGVPAQTAPPDAPIAPPPLPQATPEQIEALTRFGVNAADIAGMSAEEIGAELEAAKAAGIEPRAAAPQPAVDLAAQIEAMKAGQAPAVYIPPAQVQEVQSNPELVNQLAAALPRDGGLVQTPDGGMVITPDKASAAAIEQQVADGADVETILAEAAGRTARAAPPPLAPPRGDGSRSAPVKVELPEDVAVAAQSAASDYTPAQGEANNRKLGHAEWNGLDLLIETEAGGVRKGIDRKTGQTWETTMGSAAYGYIRGTVGADGQPVDAYIGNDPASQRVFVLDELDRDTGKFRQHKSFVGFPDQDSAVAAYTGTSSKSPEMVGGVTEMDVDEFKAWLAKGKRTRPVSDLSARQESGSAFDQSSMMATMVNADRAGQDGTAVLRQRLDGLTDAQVRQLADEQLNLRTTRSGTALRDEVVTATRKRRDNRTAAADQSRVERPAQPVGETPKRLDRYEGDMLEDSDIDAIVAGWETVREFDRRPVPMSLVRYIVAYGGIEDKGGNLRQLAGDTRGRPGLIRRPPLSGPNLFGPAAESSGYSLDDWAYKVWEAGFLPTFQQRPTINDLLDAIGEDLATGQVVRPEDMAYFEDKKVADDIALELEQYGVDTKRFRSEASLRRYLGQEGSRGAGASAGASQEAGSQGAEAAALEPPPFDLPDARDVPQAPETGPSDSGPAQEPLTPDQIERLVSAWRYVNRVMALSDGGRNVQQERIDIANELDADLAAYGITIEEFQDEGSLREYLGGGREAADPQPSRADEGEPAPAAEAQSPTARREDSRPAEEPARGSEAGEAQGAVGSRQAFIDALMSGVGDRGVEVVAPNGTTFRIDYLPKRQTYVVRSSDADAKGIWVTQGPGPRETWSRPYAASRAADDARLDDIAEPAEVSSQTPDSRRDALKDAAGTPSPRVSDEDMDAAKARVESVRDEPAVEGKPSTPAERREALEDAAQEPASGRSDPEASSPARDEKAAPAGAEQLLDGVWVRRSVNKFDDRTTYELMDAAGDVFGRATVADTQGRFSVRSIDIAKPFQRRGIASALYDKIERDFGRTLEQDNSQTDASRAFWNKRLGRAETAPAKDEWQEQAEKPAARQPIDEQFVFVGPDGKARPLLTEKKGESQGGSPDAPSEGQDTKAWLAEREERIKQSKADGNKHLDDLPRYVETMRGVEFYNVHDPKERGTVRTVSNRGDVVVNWADKYSADKNLVDEQTKDGKSMVWQSWLSPTDLNEYVVDRPKTPEIRLRDRLMGDGFKTIVEARKFAKEIGLDGTNKQIDETIERAVVAAARQIVAEGKPAAETYSNLVALYNRQPNLASRTGTSVANQAYSTPAPLAYVASRLAGTAAADTVYEPSAGNGMLLIEAAPESVTANEIDPDRAQALKDQGFTVTEQDGAEVPSLKNIDSVIMNPPFGAVKDGGKSKTFKVGDWSTTQIDHAIALNALEAMADDGRAVLILGGTKSEAVAERRKDYRGKAKREFYYRLYNQYNVVDHFTASGDLYTKQGASWPVDVIVIEGRGKSERALPAAEPPAILKTWDEIGAKLDGRPDTTQARPDRGADGRAVEGRVEPASGDAADQRPAAGGRSQRVRSETEGDAGAVRPQRDRGEPGDVGSRRNDGPAQPRGDRDGGRARDAAAAEPVRPRVKRERKEGASQAAYEPVSSAQSLDTLIPVNMADAARAAMERVARKHGSVDELVADRLGYDQDALSKYFSAEQVDALAAAIDNVERGAAFVIGDQTGIGKGRIAAGMLRYAMKRGMVPVFLTEKPDLYGDMYRDLSDIGVIEMLGREPRMFMTNTNEPVPLDQEALSWKQEADAARAAGEKTPKRRGKWLNGGTAQKVANDMARIQAGEDVADVVFTTYDQMNTVKGKTTARREFLSAVAPRAMIVMDESHNAGGAAKTGWEVRDAVMNRADFARELARRAGGVMFSSATYAKRPDVMDLYARTDMGKAVEDPKDLPALIQRGGVPMQQIVASMLAESGQYMRRERSFDGVDYALTPVEVDQKAYKQFSASMQAIFRFDIEYEDFRAEWGQRALDERGIAKSKDSGVGSGSASSISFASLMHNITNQMLLAIKAEATAQEAIKAAKAGEKPVIALANTNESFIKDFAEQEGIKIGDTLDLDFGAVLQRYLSRTLRITVKHPDGETKEHLQIPIEDLPVSLRQSYQNALNLVRDGNYEALPISPIDWIRHRLGQAGLSVKEVTGRQTMIDYGKAKPKYVVRPKTEQGPSGKRGSIAAFNSGTLDALILNRSGSTGVSMHAKSDFKDRRKRRMILAQAEGNIDTHLQMLGRVHRTGQVVTPAYSQIAADIPAESRPTAVLMKKMASLNANTTGARSSAFTVESVDFINEVGDKVVADALIEDFDLNIMLGEPLKFDENGKAKIEDVARKATGRLVLLDTEVQEQFLDRIQKAYVAEIAQLDALGENPLEAKTVDLQARTLESLELKPKQGDSPFLDAVRMEKISAKAQGRALPPAEVAGSVAEAIKTEKPTGSDAAALAELERKGREWKDGEVRRVGALIREQMRTEIADTKPDSRESTKRRLDAQLDRWMRTMHTAHPGARVRLGMPAGDMNGIVMSVERTGKAKAMGALGSWTVKIAVPDSMRQLEFPMSKLFPDGVAKGEDEKGATISRSGANHAELVAAFEDARKEGRETRYVVTGNILGGYDQTKGSGRIVNFTTEDGQIRPGILMSREFKLDEFMSKRAVRLPSGEAVAAFLDKVSDVEVTGRDGDIVVGRDRYGYFIRMAQARQKAGKYFTDKAVRDAIAPKDFERRGGFMRVEGLNRDSFVGAIDAMRKAGAVLETDTAQEEAQAIVGGMAEPSAAIGAPSYEAAQKAVLAGETYVVTPAHVAEQVSAVRPMTGMVPSDTLVGVLERLEPYGEKPIDPMNQTVRAVYRMPNGKTFGLVRPLKFFLGIRAFAAPRAMLGGRPGLLLNSLFASKSVGKTASGVAWHETFHILRRDGKVSDVVFSRLLRHALKLRVLDMKFRTYLDAVGDLEASSAPDETMRSAYDGLYRDRADKVDVMRQEAITHMLELWHHGYFSDSDVAPIRDIIDDIGSGRLAGNASGPVASQTDDGILAAIDSSIGRSMRRDLDSLGYYSKALEAARGLKQAKGTPEQMLAQLKKAGVKDAEIEATGLRSVLDGKSSITRDEIVSHLEGNRVGLRETFYQLTNDPTSGDPMPGDAGLPKWNEYSLDPSNPTYRETVLHLPSNNEARRTEMLDIEDEYGIGDALGMSDDAMADEMASATGDFTSGHFPEPNIVGHMMTSMTTHEGRPVFTIDQIQSDWGQKFRDGGVRDEARINELARALQEARASRDAAFADANEFVSIHGGSNSRHADDGVRIASALGRIKDGDAIRVDNKVVYPDEELKSVASQHLERVNSERSIVGLIEAELATAEASTPGNPLVNTTDQWVNTTLRRAIRQAVEAGAEFIAVPSGDTVLSYNPGDANGMRGFYGGAEKPSERAMWDNELAAAKTQGYDAEQIKDIEKNIRDAGAIEGIVPKNLRKLLSAIDKATPAPARIDTLDSPSGKTGLGKGFTLFRLTESAKTSVMEEGLPLFSAVPGKSESAASTADGLTPAAQSRSPQIESAIKEAVSIVNRIAGQGAVDVKLQPQIAADEALTPEQRRGLGLSNLPATAGGTYRRPTLDARAIVTLAFADPSYDLRTVAGHEAYHHVETVLASPQEMKLLRAPSEMARATRHAAAEIGRTVEETSKLPDYEIRAIAFQRYRRMREEGMDLSPLHIGIRRVWDRLVRIFRNVQNALRGQGFDSMESIFERARTGEMAGRVETDGDFDPTPPGGGSRVRSQDTMASFAGVNAKTADMNALSRAEVMEKDGKPREDIWTETGWFRGVDGQWRFEIDDSGAIVTGPSRASIAEHTGKAGSMLEELIQHPAIQAAYPGMNRNDWMAMWATQRSGKFVPGQNGAAPSLIAQAPTEDELRSVILHEMQHGIQHAEGFATGGNRQMGTVFDGMHVNFFKSEQKHIIEQMGKTGGALDPEWRELNRELSKVEQAIEVAARMEYYRRLAGEVEARLVQKRMDMTQSERRARPPWLDYDIPEAQQIIRRDLVGSTSAESSSPQLMASVYTNAVARATASRVNPIMARLQSPAMDRLRVKIQDRVLPIRRQQEAIEKATGAQLPINLNVYAAEALYHGKTGEMGADLQRLHVEPLVEHLRQNEIDGDAIDRYLYARHALERNAYIRTIDPSNDAGSGMTDAEATKILADIAASPKAAAYAEAGRRVDVITKETRDRLLAAGLISRETYDDWSSAYQFYVPLRGFETTTDDTPVVPRIGRGFDVRGPEAMQALGRRSAADSPFAYVLLQSLQAIVRAEKNKVNKALLRLAEAHPDPDVWQVYKGSYHKRINEKTGLVESYFVPAAFERSREDIVGVKVGGKQYYVQVHNPNVARALRGVGSSDFDHAVIRSMMAVTRFYAQLLTSWNPEFIVSNFFRDVQTALINSKDVKGLPDGTRKKMLADALSLKAIRGVYNALRGDGSTEYAKWFEEFRQEGGKISFLEYNDVNLIKRRIERMVNEGKMGRAWRNTAKYVEDVNTSVENGIRLSTYIAMRKAGIPAARAAFVARELTVNFNRKGEWGPIINSAYLFFNASVQGSTRMLQAIAKSKAVRNTVYAIVAGGVALELLNYIIAGDDDDGENAYEKIKPWIKERNMIFMLPGRKDYLMLPMPYGYNIPYNGGQKIGEAIRTVMGHGKLTPAKAAAGMIDSIMGSFNPLGSNPFPSDDKKNMFLQMVSPTILDPVVQVAENKTWYGGPIYPTKMPHERHKPDSETYSASVHPFFRETAAILNSWTGGNKRAPGWFDVSPEILEHYAQFAGGGVARFVLNATGTGLRFLSGEEWVPEKTPFVRRLYGAKTNVSRRSDFYQEWNKVDAAYAQYVGHSKDGDQVNAQRVLKENAAEIAAYGPMKGAQRQLSALSKERAKIQLDRVMSDAEKKPKLDAIQKRENEIIIRALAAYTNAQKQKQK